MAMTRSQLDELVADLPSLSRTPAPGRRRGTAVARIKLAWVAVLLAIRALSGAGYFWPMWVIPFLLIGAVKRWSPPGGRGPGGPPWSPRPRHSRLA